MEHYLCVLILVLIPIFGAVKNIIKRKTFNIFIFLRTFVIYFFIYLISRYFCEYQFKINLFDCMLISLLERYVMFIHKINYSFITNNYEKKKLKYYKKYLVEISSGKLNKISMTDNTEINNNVETNNIINEYKNLQ